MQYTLQQRLDTLSSIQLSMVCDALLYINTENNDHKAVAYLDSIENTLEGMYKKFIYLRATWRGMLKDGEILLFQRRPLHKKLKNADLARIDNYLKENMPDYDLFSRWFDHDDCTSEMFTKDDPYVIPTYYKHQPTLHKFNDGVITYDSCLIYNHHADRLSFGGDHSEFYAAQLMGKYGYWYGVNYTDADPSSHKFGYSQMKMALEKLFTSKEYAFNNPRSSVMPLYMRLLLIVSNARMYSNMPDSQCYTPTPRKLTVDNLSCYNDCSTLILVSRRYSMYKDGTISYTQLYADHCEYAWAHMYLFWCCSVATEATVPFCTQPPHANHCADPRGAFYHNERTCKSLQQ